MQKYTGVVIDAKGGPMTGVTVTVNVAGGGAATIYSDNGVTTKANPFSNDANGSFEFYAANGRYDIVLAKTGVTFVASDTSDIALYDSGEASRSRLSFQDGGGTLAAGQTRYVGVFGITATDDAFIRQKMPFNYILRRLFVESTVAPGASQTYVVTVRVNGADKAITVTLSGASQVTGSDLTNTFTGSAGDMVTLKAVASAGAATCSLSAGLEVERTP